MSLFSKISTFFRPLRNRRRQRYFLKKHGTINGNYFIISNNCIGGMCYHDANKEFYSPTINCYVENFLTFALNLDYYVSCNLVEEKTNNNNYPTGIIDGGDILPSIKIHFVHYQTFLEAKQKWVTRCKRMISNNGKLCIIYCMPLESCLDKEEIHKFLQINAEKKVCFYRKTNSTPPLNSDSVMFVKIPEKYQNMDYSKYTGLFSRKRYYDYFFDIDSFLFDLY